MMSALWLTCFETTLMISVPRKVWIISQDSKLVEYILNRNDFLSRVTNWGKLSSVDEFQCWPHCCSLGWFPRPRSILAPVCPSPWCDKGLWINLNAPEVAFLLPFRLQELLLLRDGTWNRSLKPVGRACCCLFLLRYVFLPLLLLAQLLRSQS